MELSLFDMRASDLTARWHPASFDLPLASIAYPESEFVLDEVISVCLRGQISR
jgi:hypothetical protein